MLYIFHVDTGTMMTFEMNLALESVSHLKEVIERACHIPPEKQVLLINGGESLEPTTRVYSYSAGTDTNPIFLFSISTIESGSPPSPSIDYGPEVDLKEQVHVSLTMPASYNTVVARAQLAQQFCDLARDQTRICERVVHDQHLQQQGWAAVVANLEDSVSNFRSRGELFEQSYQQHLESRAQYVNLFENFNNVLDELSIIPILPGLLANARESMGVPESSRKVKPNIESPVLSPGQTCDENEPMAVSNKCKSGCGDEWQTQNEEKAMTLLQWISAKGNQSTLEQMVEQCARGLEQFDDRVLESLRADIEKALDDANKTDMKEIKGLEERLCGLEQLMYESKRIVQEQSDLAMAFAQNQTRANNLGDPSILPDLCASHRRQLLVMLENYHHLRDIRGRCNRAKEELSITLYHRLRWIKYVQSRMTEVVGKLMIYHENLKRLKRHLGVVRQIQMAPQMYVCAVGEVVRRRIYSETFLAWAGDLAAQLQAVYSEELSRRRDFQSRFEGHFLNTLFSGMEDIPPAFANEAPKPFDTFLPKLVKEDINRLKSEVPNLTVSISLPHLARLADIFNKAAKKTSNPDEADRAAVEECLVTASPSLDLGSQIPPVNEDNLNVEEDRNVGEGTFDVSCSRKSMPLKDNRSFESETDTDEFEKVGQSPVQVACVAAGATTISEDGLVKMQLLAEQAHARLVTAERVVIAATDCLRKEVNQLRGKVTVEKGEFLKLIDSFRDSWEKLLSSCLTGQALDFDSQLQQEKRVVQDKDEIIRTLTHSVEEQTATVETLKASLRLRLKAEEEQQTQKEELQRLLENASNSEQSDVVHCAVLERRLEELEKKGALCEELQMRLDSISEGSREDLNRALFEQKASLELLHMRKLNQIRAEEEAEKNRALKELSDQLSREHHSQQEVLLSRFRLMASTSMERSPSDTSLEKIEFVRNPDTERESAIRLAVQDAEKKVHSEWESKLQAEIRSVKLKMETERRAWLNDTVRQVLEDNKRHLDAAQARESALKEECRVNRDTIRRLKEGSCGATGNPEGNAPSWHLARINQLESELASLKRQQSFMGSSVAVVPLDSSSNRDAGTSPEQLSLKKNLTSSANSLLQQGKINILSCMPRDTVLVVWNDNHHQYVIVQESSTLFFVNSESLDGLGLSLEAESGKRKIYSVAEVLEKEYCHARKSENRFRVPKGTKFYRVKVGPVHEESLFSKCGYRHRERQQPQQPQDEKKNVEVGSSSANDGDLPPCVASDSQSGGSMSSRRDMDITQ